MRLAHFIQRYPPALGGSEAYFANLSRYCAKRGDQVTVFTTNALSLDAFWSSSGSSLPPGIETDSGVTIRRYPLWRTPGRRWLLKPLSMLPSRLWQCMSMPCNPISFSMWRDVGQELGPLDAVHASAFPYAFPIVCARRLARRLRVPFFITPFLHLGDPDDPNDRTRRGYTSPALAWLLKEADGIFVQTPSERDAAIGLGVASERVNLQGLGVEPRECTGGDRFAARERWGLPPDAFVVGHLANLSWEKGSNDLLAALEPIWRAGQPVYLLLAGPEMPNFTKVVPSNFVLHLGPVTEAEKRDFYAAIDAFALPSRSDSFGLVLLEAWANGVPNVGYRAGGIADVIRHETDGLLVTCGNIAGLTNALRRLHDEEDLRLRLGAAGQDRLPRDFRWDDKLALVRHTIANRVLGDPPKTDEFPVQTPADVVD